MANYLLVDIGNTRLKWSLREHRKVLSSGAINGNAIIGQPLSADFAAALRHLPPAGKVWISCVGQATVLDWLLNLCREELAHGQINIAEVTEFSAGIHNDYADPKRLGVDRWLAAIGARSHEPSGDLIVVDAGTAVTVDWLSAANVYQGGAILPGAALMHDVLVGQTVGIKSAYQPTKQIVGKNTSECVNSGVGYGLVGAIERVINEMQKYINQPTKVLLAGGAANSLVGFMATPARVYPDLVLAGLQVLAEQAESHQ